MRWLSHGAGAPTGALALLLPLAREQGLRSVEITTDPDDFDAQVESPLQTTRQQVSRNIGRACASSPNFSIR